jgi:hypothetical protein
MHRLKMVGTYDVSCRDQEHHDHRVLDDLVCLFLVIEHEQTYHEKREIYA